MRGAGAGQREREREMRGIVNDIPSQTLLGTAEKIHVQLAGRSADPPEKGGG